MIINWRFRVDRILGSGDLGPPVSERYKTQIFGEENLFKSNSHNVQKPLRKNDFKDLFINYNNVHEIYIYIHIYVYMYIYMYIYIYMVFTIEGF